MAVAFVLADTVGFVRDLPHELIAAFESTLEETRESRLLLHVIDAADPAHRERDRAGGKGAGGDWRRRICR